MTGSDKSDHKYSANGRLRELEKGQCSRMASSVVVTVCTSEKELKLVSELHYSAQVCYPREY